MAYTLLYIEVIRRWSDAPSFSAVCATSRRHDLEYRPCPPWRLANP